MFNAIALLMTSVILVGAQIDECQEDCDDLNCEQKNGEKAVDVIFLVDGSESVTSENFNVSLNWTLAAVDKFEPENRAGRLKVFFIQYSSSTRFEINGTIIANSSEQIRSTVESIRQLKSGTNTSEALAYVNKEVFPKTRSHAFKILITLTDEQTRDPPQPEEINNARQNFDVMIGVTVGDALDDDFRSFSHRADPILVRDYAALRSNASILNIIVNSTYTDCIGFRMWCGPSTRGTLNALYCLCNPSNVNTSLIENFQLEITPNGTGNNLITSKTSEMSALFDGLDPYTSYTVTVNAVLSKSNVILALPGSVNCFTKGFIIIYPTCVNPSETTLHINYFLELGGITDISDFVKEFVVQISPNGTAENIVINAPNGNNASFTGLSKSTTYIVKITANPINTANIEVEPAYVNCSTTICSDECQPMPTRLVFLIDGSETITTEIFNAFLDWILTTVDKFRAKDSRELRVTAVQYSSSARTEIPDQLIQFSAEEIRENIQNIIQFREGTKPYSALRFINNNVNLNETFYNVHIMLSDGISETEAEDQSVIVTARNNFDVMLAVETGMLDITFLRDFAYQSSPFSINDAQTLDNVIDNITRESHDDCIKFDAVCLCNEGDTSVSVSYNAQLFGSITNESEVITNYLVSMMPGGNSTEIALGTTNTSFTSLSLYTTHLLKIDGAIRHDKCGIVVPKYVNCTTRAIIQPNVSCDHRTDTKVVVTFDPQSSGFNDDFSVLQGFVAEVSPGGTSDNFVYNNVTDHTASFTGLSPSTEYNIIIYPIETPEICAVNSSHSAVCSTKARTRVMASCLNSTRNSVTVNYSASTTDPGGHHARIRVYRLTISPIGDTEDRDEPSYSFPGLSPSTTYTITVTALPADGVDDVIIADSVKCTTKGVIQIYVGCGNATDISLTTNYFIDPEVSEVIENFKVEISALGSGINVLTLQSYKRVATFSGLVQSTNYLITVSATIKPGADFEIDSNSANCSTKVEICKDRPIDLVFLMDGSESIDPNDFNAGLNWTSETVNRFNQHARTETLRVIAVQYSNTAQKEFDRVIPPTGTIDSDVTNVTQIRSSTQAYSALQYITSDVTPNARNRSCRILITISDGDSTQPRDQSVINTIKMDYDIIIEGGNNQPVRNGAQLQDLSTVGKPLTFQNSASISNIVTEALETCCRKETTLRVDIVVSCETTANSMIVNYYPIPITIATNSSLIENYLVNISAKAQNDGVVNSLEVTMASFIGLFSSTSYSVVVSGNIIDGADVEVMSTIMTCITKDPCLPSPCQNGGTCQSDGRSDYKCDCLTEWTGINCEIPFIKPMVKCIFTTDTTIVVGYSVSPPERGHDSLLISGYSVEISATGLGTNSIKNTIRGMTASFSQLSQSTDYTFSVSATKVDGANVEVETGSTTCRTKTVIRPTVTCSSRTNDSITVSHRTDVTDLSIIQGYTITKGMLVVKTPPGNDTTFLSGLPACTEYTITVDANINPSRLDDVILEQGSVMCQTGDSPIPPTYDVVTANSRELVINIDAISCASSYTIIYTRFNCNTSVTEARTITGTIFTVPRRDDTEKYSIILYANYLISGLSEGTARNVSAISDQDCGCSSSPEPQDRCRILIVILSVLLGVAVLVAIILVIVLCRRG